ncbi:MAG: prolipoprotein diacylglyceryl transferase [Clostridia bacterium]|nr:prolipoprotein diacylglyceryl transferase [Clostridia bacterium]
MLPEPIFGNVHMYGIMIGIGLAAGFIILAYYCKKKHINEKFSDFLFFNGVSAVFLGFMSASLFQSVYNYIENPERGFKLGGSMTFLGGLIGGVVFFLIVYAFMRKRYTTRLFEILSIVPCVITIAHGFGRIGCFFAGCCYGKPTDSFLGVKFPHLSHTVHPTQLYEAAFLFILFGIFTFLLFKYDFKHSFSVYLIAYGTFRFLLEYLRGDHRGELLGFISPSQTWSFCMVLIGIALIFFVKHWYKLKEEKENK